VAVDRLIFLPQKTIEIGRSIAEKTIKKSTLHGSAVLGTKWYGRWVLLWWWCTTQWIQRLHRGVSGADAGAERSSLGTRALVPACAQTDEFAITDA
jgi:hypothetical protein